MESVKTCKVHFGEQIVLKEDTRLDDTCDLDGLVDVHSVNRSPIGGIVGSVSPYIEKLEYVSLLVQIGLVKVFPQPHSVVMEDDVWSKIRLVHII